MNRRRLLCFESELGFPTWILFIETGYGVKEIRIYDNLEGGIIPEGLVKELKEVISKWVSKYPCFEWLDEEED